MAWSENVSLVVYGLYLAADIIRHFHASISISYLKVKIRGVYLFWVYVIKLCSQLQFNVSGSKKSSNSFAQNSENMCEWVADDMSTLYNEIYNGVILSETAFVLSSLSKTYMIGSAWATNFYLSVDVIVKKHKILVLGLSFI